MSGQERAARVGEFVGIGAGVEFLFGDELLGGEFVEIRVEFGVGDLLVADGLALAFDREAVGSVVAGFEAGDREEAVALEPTELVVLGWWACHWCSPPVAGVWMGMGGVC